jgi:hypothetical protein
MWCDIGRLQRQLMAKHKVDIIPLGGKICLISPRIAITDIYIK